jgi:hypothetical protein
MTRQREVEERKSLLQKESMMPRITNLIDLDNGYSVRASSKLPKDENVLSPNTSNSEENEMDLDSRYTLGGIDTDLECASEHPKYSNFSTQGSNTGS